MRSNARKFLLTLAMAAAPAVAAAQAPGPLTRDREPHSGSGKCTQGDASGPPGSEDAGGSRSGHGTPAAEPVLTGQSKPIFAAGSDGSQASHAHEHGHAAHECPWLHLRSPRSNTPCGTCWRPSRTITRPRGTTRVIIISYMRMTEPGRISTASVR